MAEVPEGAQQDRLLWVIHLDLLRLIELTERLVAAVERALPPQP